ncbi:TPA: hypothetical protein HA338_00120 [Methanosarcina acetivorans]|uniref:Uncharacterized protein n=1 Tax=Methanosarcina acetivorans TaxID=2214 RepID=A0A832SD83_9EURY|nr:hypothetical protein [Methanosarcina acetivorans]HIH92499.1 hypothetical protein [Methanosarcina acetivorans]
MTKVLFKLSTSMPKKNMEFSFSRRRMFKPVGAKNLEVEGKSFVKVTK